MRRDELEGKGQFEQCQAKGDRIQQLQQQIEAWEAMLEKLGGNE
ncbi:hypothetical protein [Microseira sp. BLCC-F43]